MKIILILGIIISFVFGWVGEITALKGKANIIRDTKILQAKIGFKLEKEDKIKTLKNTKIQIIFKDNTVITIGKNSEVKISDYLFDGENSKVNFRLSHGIMKTLTGKIGKFAPKRFKVLTKNASIGIRGTYFVVETDKDIVKLGMLSGVTVFTDLKDMKTYEVKKGEQLVFNPKTDKKIIIKKNFIEPNSVKLNNNNNNDEKEVENVVSDVNDNDIDVTKSTIKDDNSKVFTKFIEGLKDLF